MNKSVNISPRFFFSPLFAPQISLPKTIFFHVVWIKNEFKNNDDIHEQYVFLLNHRYLNFFTSNSIFEENSCHLKYLMIILQCQ